MYRILLATLVISLLLSCNDSQKNSATIKVSGEGKIRIKPDLIYLTIKRWTYYGLRSLLIIVRYDFEDN